MDIPFSSPVLNPRGLMSDAWSEWLRNNNGTDSVMNSSSDIVVAGTPAYATGSINTREDQ